MSDQRTPIKRIVAATIMSIFAGTVLSTGAAAQPVDPARQASAEKIIKAAHDYGEWAKLFLCQAEQTIDQAQLLKGKANKYESNVIARPKPLHGAELARARLMYAADLKEFAEHARQYQAHTDQVRAQVGQCQASRRAYERNKDAYTLHCQDFHLKSIPPPHICHVVGASMADMRSVQGKVMEGMRRMMQSEAELMTAEERLNNAEKDSARVDGDVRKQHEADLQEQALLEQFGRLQEEYRQLDVERKALASSGGTAVVKNVHANIKH